jgi:hypothetical protein
MSNPSAIVLQSLTDAEARPGISIMSCGAHWACSAATLLHFAATVFGSLCISIRNQGGHDRAQELPILVHVPEMRRAHAGRVLEGVLGIGLRVHVLRLELAQGAEGISGSMLLRATQFSARSGGICIEATVHDVSRAC